MGEGGQQGVWARSIEENRGDKRSITPSGFAQAFFEANQ